MPVRFVEIVVIDEFHLQNGSLTASIPFWMLSDGIRFFSSKTYSIAGAFLFSIIGIGNILFKEVIEKALMHHPHFDEFYIQKGKGGGSIGERLNRIGKPLVEYLMKPVDLYDNKHCNEIN